jgi:TolB-like protein
MGDGMLMEFGSVEISSLFIIARNSTISYKGKQVNVRQSRMPTTGRDGADGTIHSVGSVRKPAVPLTSGRR